MDRQPSDPRPVDLEGLARWCKGRASEFKPFDEFMQGKYLAIAGCLLELKEYRRLHPPNKEEAIDDGIQKKK